MSLVPSVLVPGKNLKATNGSSVKVPKIRFLGRKLGSSEKKVELSEDF